MKIRIRKSLLACTMAASLLAASHVTAEEVTPTVTPAVDVSLADDTILTNQITGWPEGPFITSTAAYLMEPSTGTVLYSKNPDLALYPSSSVKIMTALVALENSALTDEVLITETGTAGVIDGATSLSAQLGESFTMEQALYAVILASANDMSLQIAEKVGGSVEEFVKMMNTKATEIGCTNTLFTNPTGMPDEAQYTTAHDLALIMNAAMGNETFRTMAAAPSYTIPATNLSSGERVITNSFKMMDSQSDAYYIGCLGGKEGFTSASNSVLTCMANRNDTDLVCAVMNGAAEQTDDEAITILDYAYNNFQMMDLAMEDFQILSGGQVYVPNGTTPEQISAKDSYTKDGYISRAYRFNEASVGSAVADIIEEEDTTTAIEGQKNMEAALAASGKQSILPYFLIGGVGILLFVLVLRFFIKKIKKK